MLILYFLFDFLTCFEKIFAPTKKIIKFIKYINKMVQVIKLTPRGFCQGVVNAINVLQQAINDYPNKHIYCVGWIVHNQSVVNTFIKQGVIFLDDTKQSRMKLIQELHDPNAVVVFSAHGTDDKVIALAKTKGFIVLDATCKYVKKIHDLIHANINHYHIIYIGKKNHPESIATLAINPNIIFIDVDEYKDPNKLINLHLDENERYYLLNQTTIALYDYLNIQQYLQNHYHNIVFDNEICDATTNRQKAVLNMPNDVDLLIVVGDHASNNSNQLCYLGQTKHIESHLVLNAKDLDPTWFTNKHKVAITAGTSSPKDDIKDIVNAINKIVKEK